MDKKEQGKKNRKSGKAFELVVRKDLENEGFIISKWCNNVSEPFEQEVGEYYRKLIPAKPQYNPFFKRIIGEGSGFPDFIGYRNIISKIYEIIGVEVKVNGYLSKEEKDKCKWLLDKGIFHKIFVAYKGKKKGEILYKYATHN